MSRNKRRLRVVHIHRETVLITFRFQAAGTQIGMAIHAPADPPELLRFGVMANDYRTLSALTWPGDTAKPNERLYAGRIFWTGTTNTSGVTAVRRPRHWWYTEIQYVAVNPQPPQMVMREYDAWRRWCADFHGLNLR